MFYIIAAIISVLVYLFLVPKEIKQTVTAVGLVLIVATLLAVLILVSVHVIKAPHEILLTLVMIGLGYFALRDINQMKKK